MSHGVARFGGRDGDVDLTSVLLFLDNTGQWPIISREQIFCTI